jgi:hypothetical protein
MDEFLQQTIDQQSGLEDPSPGAPGNQRGEVR